MPVTPFDPGRYTVHTVPAHVDSASHVLLLAVLSDLVAIRDGEPDPQRAERLRTITRAMGEVLERLEPPRGAA